MDSQLKPDLANLTEATLRAYAAIVFGGEADAACWFERPAVALNHLRPVDLIGTDVGRELVMAVLGRIDYGVYT